MMRLDQESTGLDTGRVALELLWLMARALLLGVAIAVVLAGLVVWVAIVAP